MYSIISQPNALKAMRLSLRSLRFLARFNINFVQRFDMLGDERDGHHKHLLYAFPAQALDRFGERRMQPLRWSDAALVAQEMNLWPRGVLLRSQLAYQAHRLFNLLRIGITFFDQAHRQPVRAENKMNARAIWKLP